MLIKKKYTQPQLWAEEPELETAILLVSGDGEDLVGEDDDPWLVGGDY